MTLKFVWATTLLALVVVFLRAGPSGQPPTIIYGFDGALPVPMRVVSLTNLIASSTLTARNNNGAQIIEKGGRWMVVSAPAAGSVGSASIALEASVRHVVDCVSFSGASSGGAVTAAAGTFVVRDGATGAGTIIWAYAAAHQVAAGAGIQTILPHSICGLNLVGTTGTAMTAEFDAGITNELQRASLSGYNVQ